MHRKFVFLAAAACAVLTILVVTVPAQVSRTPKEQLGKDIFFDENLSLNSNQSCATCHHPAAGWTGPDSIINAHGAVYEGSIAGAFGDRKPPSAAYATQSPILHMDKRGLFVGGNFWDGLKEKLLAAHRGGIRTVLIPDENVKDLAQIPDIIKGNLEIKPVKWIDEVLPLALRTMPHPVTAQAAADTPKPAKRPGRRPGKPVHAH